MAALSIKRVISGSATIASGNASVSVAIGANVVTNKTRVVAKGAPGDTWSPERLYFTIELNDIGGGLSDEITFTRAGSPAVALYIEWHLIEYEAGASVTWLSYNTGASWGGTDDQTISAVDLDKTLVIPSYRVANTTTGTTLHYLCRWELTSATNLRVTSKDSTLAVAAVVQIVKYDSDSGVTVQQVTQAMAGTTTENATISTVTLAHTLVFGSSETSSTNGNDIMNCGWAELTSTTNLQFRRRGTADTYTATAFVVDYGAGAAQRGYNEQSNYTSLTIDQTISAVDTDFSTAQLGGGTFAFGHVGATSTNWQIRAFVPTLTSATNLRGTRQFTNSTACGIAWQVMDWTALMAGGGDYDLSLDGGTAAMVGQAIGLRVARQLALGGAAAAMTGQTIGALAARLIAVGHGSLAIVGQDVTLVYTPSGGGADYTLGMGGATAVMAGQLISLSVSRTISLSAGALAMAGQSIGLYRGYPIALSGGAAAMQGQSLDFSYSRRLIMDNATLSMVGQPVGLIRLGDEIVGTLSLSAFYQTSIELTAIYDVVFDSNGSIQ